MSSIIVRGKDKTSTMDNAGVVYKFLCNNCPKSYVGETKRQLQIRIKEHQSDIKHKRDTVVSEHANEFQHEFDFNDVQILDRENRYYSRILSEMIYILLQDSPLNKQEDTNKLSSMYKNLCKNF